MKKVSVIIPLYNEEKYILKCINSVINQTYKNIEIIVIDDKSTDNSLKVLKSIKDKRIKIIELLKNQGVSNARNKGIEIATGDYICFLDSDDFWDYKKLEKQIKFIKNKTFIYSDYVFTNKHGIETKRVVVPNSLTYKEALKNTCIFTSTVMFNMKKIKKEDLDKMNITSKCIVINQCSHNNYEKYKNFRIYSYNEKGISKSRNRALALSKEDILIFCDDDVVYNKDYEKTILNEFKNNPKADVIFFNLNSPNRYQKQNIKNKRLHIYNSLKYGTVNIAVRKRSIDKYNINFNKFFGSKEYFYSGEDTMFIVNCLKNKLKLYSSTKYLGTVNHDESQWFKGYNEKYFFDKGALFCAINKTLRHLLCLQYLIRYKETLTEIKFIQAYKIMLKGANYYLKINNNS